MGYAFCLGPCLCCKKVFPFNPNTVPSVRVKGIKEPVCEECMVLANEERKAMGLSPFQIHPDAYEPCEESEL